jgi:PAS domain S-box-containing protein
MTRILVVEDSPTQAEQIRLILEGRKVEVEIASDAEKGLDRLKTSNFDLILSDILMPGLSGYDLCRTVKSDPKLKDIPVILLTTLNDPMDIIQGLECGADNFLTKPCEANYLITRVETILENKRLRTGGKLKVGVEIYFLGKKFTITSDKEQILDLLISTFEDIVRANQELVSSQNRLQALYHIAGGLNEAQNEREVLQTALNRTMEMRGIQAGWVLLLEGADLRLAATCRLPPALQSVEAFEGGCLCRREFLSGKLTSATNIDECERLQNQTGDACRLRCHASIPLRSGDRLLGIMNLAGAGDGLLGEDDLKTLDGIGNQISIALDRARLQEKMRGRIRLSEQKYHHLMEHANDAIFLLDPSGKILEANRQAATILGRSESEIVGRNYVDFVTPEDMEAGQTHFRTLLSRGSVLAPNLHMMRGDKTDVSVDFSASLIAAEDEHIVLAIVRDVTERNQLELQLRQAQKMEAIGSLAGGVAHDFNNLLTIILGYGEVLFESMEPQNPMREEVQAVIDAARRAATLTGQLLSFSRKQVFQPRVVDLNTLVSDISRMLRRLIGENIELTTSFDPALGRVRVDPSQIEQVIMNLTVNARDAMPVGGKVTIETCNVELDQEYASQHAHVEPGPYVMLAVTDTGVGMNEEIRSRAFEPFFTTKKLGEGTGLGLATVYGIIKQSGGHVFLYSELGYGTSFKIYLPRIIAPVDAPFSNQMAEKPQTGTETILVVEDDAAVRQLAVLALRDRGYAVFEASNGEEALRLSQEHASEPIELLMTDIVMPQMGGRDLFDRIRIQRPQIRVLFASGYTDKAILNHWLTEPGTMFLQKPFTPGMLARRIREVLDESQG